MLKDYQYYFGGTARWMDPSEPWLQQQWIQLIKNSASIMLAENLSFCFSYRAKEKQVPHRVLAAQVSHRPLTGRGGYACWCVGAGQRRGARSNGALQHSAASALLISRAHTVQSSCSVCCQAGVHK
jgi:hypothetical protein